MAIYLAQHGKAFSKEENSARPLNDQGIIESRKSAIELRCSKVNVEKIFHSGKERAKQTAEILSIYNTPGNIPEAIDGINPTDDVQSFAATLKSESNFLYVGHLPFLEKLISFLITGDEMSPVVKFTNAGVVCLDKTNETWIIKWTSYPNLN